MAKAFELRVKVLEIGETETLGANNFRKREVVGILEGEYPEHYKFEFVQDNVDLPDNLIEGTYATISFNLKGKKVEKPNKPVMYFTTLQAWKIEG